MIQEQQMIDFGSSSSAYLSFFEAAKSGDIEKIQKLLLENKLWIDMPNKLSDFMDHIPNKETKIEMLLVAIPCALSCGDFQLANKLVERIPKSDLGHELACRTIKNFSELLQEFEKKTAHLFEITIRNGLRTLNTEHNKTFAEKIIEQMIQCTSFKAAFEYAKTLEDPQERAFARCGLSHCKLDEVVLLSKAMGEKQIEELYSEVFDNKSKEIKKCINFGRCLKCVDEIKIPWIKYQMVVSVANSFCQKGSYEEVYRFHQMLAQLDVVFMGLNEAIQNIIDHLKEKNETEWIEKFSKLLR